VNPDGVQKGVKEIVLNGKVIKGALPQQPTGSVNEVLVTMG
jgi:hypothetical protein